MKKCYYLFIFYLILICSCSNKQINFINDVRKNSLINNQNKIIEKFINQCIKYHYVYRDKIQYDYYLKIFDNGNIELSELLEGKTIKYYTTITWNELNAIIKKIYKLKQSNLLELYETQTIIQEHNILIITSTNNIKNIDFKIQYYNYNPHDKVKIFIDELLELLMQKKWERYSS